jgi:hypothetical protein
MAGCWACGERALAWAARHGDGSERAEHAATWPLRAGTTLAGEVGRDCYVGVQGGREDERRAAARRGSGCAKEQGEGARGLHAGAPGLLRAAGRDGSRPSAAHRDREGGTTHSRRG